MELEYLIRNTHDDDGLKYELHFLVDLTSGRAYGYVETPSPDEFMFVSAPYEGKTRWYITLESAKAYLESVVSQADIDECSELAKSIAEKPAVKEEVS